MRATDALVGQKLAEAPRQSISNQIANRVANFVTSGNNPFLQDMRLAHCRRWPERQPSIRSTLILLASSPGLWALLTHRCAHWAFRRSPDSNFRVLKRIAPVILAPMKLAVRIFAKSEIDSHCVIENGIFLADQGNIIFGASSTGSGTVIGRCVTFGRSLADIGRPVIGRNVWVGPNCVVYGAISIGDGATILPGSVVTRNVPSGVVMQGNPARVVLRYFDNSVLRTNDNLDQLVDLLKR